MTDIELELCEALDELLNANESDEPILAYIAAVRKARTTLAKARGVE